MMVVVVMVMIVVMVVMIVVISERLVERDVDKGEDCITICP